MELKKDHILPIIQQALPDFSASGKPVQLSGGNLNFIWRIPGTPNNLILKHAPPYIARQPEISLNPNRIHFEASALQQFKQSGRLNHLVTEQIRPPKLYYFDSHGHLLIMEDVGDRGHLFRGQLCKDHKEMAVQVGSFIGQLHRETTENSYFKEHFNNRGVQQTRLEVQYSGAKQFLKNAGIDPDPSAAENAIALGEKLLKPGKCLIMGDLWPPSLIKSDDGIRIIDWEFSHYGSPIQDIAHLMAHCTMYLHLCKTDQEKDLFRNFGHTFINSYRSSLGDTYEILIRDEDRHDFNVHFAMEILIRTCGVFKDGYLFDGYSKMDPVVQEMAQKAYKLLVNPDNDTVWGI